MPCVGERPVTSVYQSVDGRLALHDLSGRFILKFSMARPTEPPTKSGAIADPPHRLPPNIGWRAQNDLSDRRVMMRLQHRLYREGARRIMSEEDRSARATFEADLRDFVSTFRQGISTKEGDWTVKGFIDIYKNIYTISSDTKIVSKILEIHLFPLLLQFAEQKAYIIVLADHQNYYPDMTFIDRDDNSKKFAVDFKTTYRKPDQPGFCNGFTLGSHGLYFTDRSSTKNIQFPYREYDGHFCLGIIYDRAVVKDIDETKRLRIDDLESITSVISNIQFFVAEKWRIASDKRGSGNTANIGSINYIEHITAGRGMFSDLGEEWFDDYWMNFNKISITTEDGKTKRINSLEDFVKYRGGPVELARKKRGVRG